MKLALFYKQLTNLGGAEKLVLKEAQYLTRLTGNEVPILCIKAERDVVNAFAIESVRLIESKHNYPHLKLAGIARRLNISHLISSSGHIDCFLIAKLARCSYSLHVHHPLMMSPTDKLKYAYSNRIYYKRHLHKSNEVSFLESQRISLGLRQVVSLNMYDLVYKYVLRNAKHVFVLSPSSKLEKEEMLKCSNIVDIAGAISDINIDTNRYSATLSTKSEINILSLGRLVWDKRFDLVINAVHLLNTLSPHTYRLKIVGSGPHEKHLKSIADPRYVSFYGNANERTLNSIWDKTDIFCTPDWADFKLTMFESLSRGIFTIVSNETDVSKTLYQSGYLVSLTPDITSIALTIHELATSRIKTSTELLRASLSPLLWHNYFSQLYNIISN